jgi:hypothetical protein
MLKGCRFVHVFTLLHFTDDERAPLPPEMYINQQKWLELRAKRRSTLSCICNNVHIVSWKIQFSSKRNYPQMNIFSFLPHLSYTHQATWLIIIFWYLETSQTHLRAPTHAYDCRLLEGRVWEGWRGNYSLWNWHKSTKVNNSFQFQVSKTIKKQSILSLSHPERKRIEAMRNPSEIKANNSFSFFFQTRIRKRLTRAGEH